ncbi:MAG: ribonuclease J [Clostridiales bacterium]|nr:ribonuclease J [Clostridiales bacterium]
MTENQKSQNRSSKKASGVAREPNNRVKLNLKKPGTTEQRSAPNQNQDRKPAQKNSRRNKGNGGDKKNTLRVIPLGGLGEIGKNMTLFEYGNDIVIIDCGVAFPEEHMPGIDAVIQDFSYVLARKDKVRGIFLTHGHEDHIGALPYLLPDLKCPIYGGKLTIELLRRKLIEKRELKGVSLNECMAGDIVKSCASFTVEFIRVNHSIADAFAIALRTPLGNIIHTGDFKIDYTPINGDPIDLQRLAEYGHRKVLLLLADSTNVEKPGVSPSEMHVGESFQHIFQNTPGRIFVATFSSHVHRMQQIFTAAEAYDRKVALVGRSMLNVFSAANSLGYIQMKPDTLIDINDIDKYAPEKLVIVTTGSQAEPMSALSRMAFSSHRIVDIHQGDTVILSANLIPGNEKPIYRLINELFRLGAHVIYESLAEVHVSGHAYRNELKLIHQLIKPKYFIPVHGEYRMLFRHAEVAKSLGQPWEDIFIMNNGDVLEINEKSAALKEPVNAAPVLIDGSGIGDLDNRVLRDRKALSDDGVITLFFVADKATGKLKTQPIIQAMGFLYESESEETLKECSKKIVSYIEKNGGQSNDLSGVIYSRQMRDYIRNLLYERTKRRPMIMISLARV